MTEIDYELLHCPSCKCSVDAPQTNEFLSNKFFVLCEDCNIVLGCETPHKVAILWYKLMYGAIND